MNILVTGGAGFIGSHIAEHFLSEGHNVTILDNLATGYLHNIPKSDNVTFIEGDICDPATVAEAVKGTDYVFHHAALVSGSLMFFQMLIDRYGDQSVILKSVSDR